MSVYIIARKDKLLYHFGILLESGRVLHYGSITNNMFACDQGIKCDNLDDFARQRKVRVVDIITKLPEAMILNRTKTYLIEKNKYSIRKNNCILFVLWCLKIEERKSFLIVLKYYIRYMILMYTSRRVYLL